MRKMNKIAAVILAAAMTMSMGTVSFAETSTPIVSTVASEDDWGTITVTGVTDGSTITAYKVAEAEFDAKGNFIGYKSLVEGVTDVNALNAATLTAQITSDIHDKVYTGSYEHTTDLSHLALGTYVIIVSDTTDGKVYNPMMGSVYYDPDEEGNGEFVLGSEITAKSTDGGNTTKEIVSVDSGNNIGSTVNGTATDKITVGSVVTFKVTGKVPNYNEAMYNEINYVLTDTPSAGLTIDASSVEVNGEKDSPYISVNNNVLTFTLKKNANENTIHNYLNKTIEITYTATVNADAVESNEFNNSVILNYTNAPGEEKSTREKETHLYTYDIDGKVQKVDENHQPLAGATFTLYIDEDCKTPFQYVGQGALTWTTTEDNNDIEFKDLPAGTYYIQETAAPGGYKLNGKKFKVTIEPVKNDVGEPTADAVVTVTDMDHNNDVVTEIINTKLSTLPSTGGMGTYVFTIVGVVIMAGAAGLLIAKRRRDA